MKPRTPAWIGILAAVVFAMAGGACYLTVCKALDHALAVASWCGR